MISGPYSTPPKAWMAVWGNLVQYESEFAALVYHAEAEGPHAIPFSLAHDHGGHFPALDNPEGLVGDLRKFVLGYWKR